MNQNATSNLPKYFRIPKTKRAENHKGVCLLQVKSMISSGLKLDTSVMFINKKDFKEQSFIQEIPFFLFPKMSSSHNKNYSLLETPNYFQTNNKKTLSHEIILDTMQKMQIPSTIHQNLCQKNKNRFKINFKKKLMEDYNEINTENSLKVRRLDPLDVKNLFHLPKISGKNGADGNNIDVFYNNIKETNENIGNSQNFKSNEQKNECFKFKKTFIKNQKNKENDTFFPKYKEEKEDNLEQIEEFVAYVNKTKTIP